MSFLRQEYATSPTGQSLVPMHMAPRHPTLKVIVVGGALAVSGTSSAEPNRVWEDPYQYDAESTASGPDWELPEQEPEAASQPATTRAALAEVRRVSGLTWEQLGSVFGVSRRSVHFWASGKALNAANEEKLMRLLDFVRHADRGSARETRAFLLTAEDGETPIDLLTQARFDEALALVGAEQFAVRRELPALSHAARAARRPAAPAEMLEARSERVHKSEGRVRAARTARKRRGSE